VFLGRTARLLLMVERAGAGILQFVPGRPIGSNRLPAKSFIFRRLKVWATQGIDRAVFRPSNNRSGSPNLTLLGEISHWFARRRAAVLHIMHA